MSRHGLSTSNVGPMKRQWLTLLYFSSSSRSRNGTPSSVQVPSTNSVMRTFSHPDQASVFASRSRRPRMVLLGVCSGREALNGLGECVESTVLEKLAAVEARISKLLDNVPVFPVLLNSCSTSCSASLLSSNSVAWAIAQQRGMVVFDETEICVVRAKC